MRLTLSVFILAIIITACSSRSAKPALATDLEMATKLTDKLLDQRFAKLESILASDLGSRDLLQAKNLILKLKNILPANHNRKMELIIAERWVQESIDCQTNIKLLNMKTRMLYSQVTKQKAALKQVRKMLVSE